MSVIVSLPLDLDHRELLLKSSAFSSTVVAR